LLSFSALTAHEYLHLSMPRWRHLWSMVLDSYMRSAAPAASSASSSSASSSASASASSSADRTEDLMLALVAFLLQRLPADASLPADRRPALPVSFPPALVNCARIASLGGTFRHACVCAVVMARGQS
jgi:hypothetical protein